MNTLDSRHLRVGDTFAQRFMNAGTYRYTVGIRSGLQAHDHQMRFEVRVADEPGDASRTENLKVTFADKAFEVDRAEVSIRRNDVVLWSCVTPSAPGLAVRGHGPSDGFDSAALRSNSMYSHAFGVPGEIEWADAFAPELCGTILVQDHRCRTADEWSAYAATLRKPTLVMVDGRHARPNRVRVTIGQTVFFAVREGTGISIVDRRLLQAVSDALNPQPLPPGPPPDRQRL